MAKQTIAERFSVIAQFVSQWSASWQASALAAATIVIWLLSGFYFGFASEIYNLVISSITTCITFLMVFIIQNTQTRDTKAMQIKLDELIRATHDARDQFKRLEDRPAPELDQIRDRDDT